MVYSGFVTSDKVAAKYTCINVQVYKNACISGFSLIFLLTDTRVSDIIYIEGEGNTTPNTYERGTENEGN